MDIVTVDLGGTNARFSIAKIKDRQVVEISDAITLPTAHHATFTLAWQDFAKAVSTPLPRAAAIAVACPVTGGSVKLTNNSWIISPTELKETLGLDAITLVNDFGAIAHAMAQLDAKHFLHITGPDVSLPQEGVLSIVGPGTGLGVAQLLRRHAVAHVIETEGGHSDFAPLDSIEDKILQQMRERHRRVSVERIVSGPGLLAIYQALAAIEGLPATIHDDKILWATALDGKDSLATLALDRFCMALGSVAGDIALTHGASAVIIAGGIGSRIADILPNSSFSDRFKAKGRFEHIMSSIPVKLITHPQVGLLGAAAAFVEEHIQ